MLQDQLRQRIFTVNARRFVNVDVEHHRAGDGTSRHTDIRVRKLFTPTGDDIDVGRGILETVLG